MLAQNFQTAADLGITDAEQDALIKVLGMLERGEIDSSHFDMNQVWCKSVGCIWGWARHVSHGEAFGEGSEAIQPFYSCEYSENRTPLGRLFANCCDSDIMRRVQETARPHHAAIALRSYLTTGEANWSEALS